MAIRDPKGHPCKHWYCVKFSKDEWESVFLQILEIQTIPTKCFKFFLGGGTKEKKKELSLCPPKHYISPVSAMSLFTAGLSFCIDWNLRQCFKCTII